MPKEENKSLSEVVQRYEELVNYQYYGGMTPFAEPTLLYRKEIRTRETSRYEPVGGTSKLDAEPNTMAAIGSIRKDVLKTRSEKFDYPLYHPGVLDYKLYDPSLSSEQSIKLISDCLDKLEQRISRLRESTAKAYPGGLDPALHDPTADGVYLHHKEITTDTAYISHLINKHLSYHASDIVPENAMPPRPRERSSCR